MNIIFGGTAPSAEWGIGLGVVAFFASAAWFGVTIQLRSKTDERLRPRIDIAHAGLAEQGIALLRSLDLEIQAILPLPHAPFDPQTGFPEPDEVQVSATKAIVVLRMRKRLRRRFIRLLKLCTQLRNASLAFIGLVLAATALYLLAFEVKWLWGGVLFLAVLTAVVGIIGLIWFVRLESQIQASVEASNPLEPDDATGGVA